MDDDLDPSAKLLADVEAFLLARQMSATAFGRVATGDPTLVHQMRQGRELRLGLRVRVRRFLKHAAAEPGRSMSDLDASHVDAAYLRQHALELVAQQQGLTDPAQAVRDANVLAKFMIWGTVPVEATASAVATPSAAIPPISRKDRVRLIADAFDAGEKPRHVAAKLGLKASAVSARYIVIRRARGIPPIASGNPNFGRAPVQP